MNELEKHVATVYTNLNNRDQKRENGLKKHIADLQREIKSLEKGALADNGLDIEDISDLDKSGHMISPKKPG